VAPIKTHNTVMVTLALKNLAVGALRDRVPLHQGWPAINLSIYGLAPLVGPHLSVLDGFQGMEGDGPGNGEPVDLRAAVASTDYVAADTVGASLMDHDPNEIGYLVYCHRAGLGEANLANISIRGNCTLEDARRRFQKHPNYGDQLGWRTSDADRLVLPGALGDLDWRSESGLIASSITTGSTPETEGPNVAPQPREPESHSPTVAVPAGGFIMGEAGRHTDRPFELTLPAYRIGLHPVTNEEYSEFTDDGGYTERWRSVWTDAGWRYIQDFELVAPRRWGQRNGDEPNHPVVGVSWYEARAYCGWLRAKTARFFALPTEAQWERAARGKDGRCYPWGDRWEQGRCNSAEAGVGHTTAVTQFPAGRSDCGVYDMAGNVWEWCSSAFRSYPYRRDDGREDPDAVGVRVVRGGSWFARREFAGCAYRNFLTEGMRADHLGFRVVELQ
jgi:formylglycine-generating enzyme required for sulfatase activity